MNRAEVVAVVLAGGQSTRLGRDKALVEVDGLSLLARAVRLAGRVCAEVYVSGRDPGLTCPAIPWFEDDTPRIGPMGGIITALSRLSRPVLALSCDMPLMTEAVLAELLAASREIQPGQVMTVHLHPETGFIESLAAIYETSALSYLHKAYAQGIYKLSRAIPAPVRRHIPCARGQEAVFFNVNRPEDLARLEDVRPPR